MANIKIPPSYTGESLNFNELLQTFRGSYDDLSENSNLNNIGGCPHGNNLFDKIHLRYNLLNLNTANFLTDDTPYSGTNEIEDKDYLIKQGFEQQIGDGLLHGAD
jgi:hypothetical protein